MRIAISQRVIETAEYPETRDGLSQEWGAFIRMLRPDAILLPVPNDQFSIEQWLTDISPDAVILSGGNDIGNAPERDSTEKKIIEWFLDAERPVLGVCRGLQILNSFYGGGVTRDIREETGEEHAGIHHEIRICDQTFSHAAKKDSLTVNSFHNQGVVENQLAQRLIPFAKTISGVVEGLFSSSEKVLAIQWHPERPSPSTEFDQAIIRQFLFE